jgi:hypothetical protein
MQCNEVIQELAVPTDDCDPRLLAEHLAACSSCSGWAERAKRFDRLWDATRPVEPTGEIWDSVWTRVSAALEESRSEERAVVKISGASRNGAAVRVEESSGSNRGFGGFGRRRVMAVASVLMAQAAAILLVVSLSWQPFGGLSSVRLVEKTGPQSIVTTEAIEAGPSDGVEIEEGQQIVIRIDGTTSRVVDLAPEGMSHNVDDWYLVFNKMEAIASPPVVAVR